MSFLNLGLGELLGLIGGISAAVVALYLLDRSKRRQVVSTLHFWAASDVRTDLRHRRRIQQPWSLLLQLISLALLLAAIAGPRFGVFDGGGRDHVVILDTSAWMGSRTGQGTRTLMDDAKGLARAYVRALPSRDRVMLVRADALATPATAFESNRQVVEDAIRLSQAQASALNLSQAFEFAQRAQKQAQRAGEIVFAGSGRVSVDDAAGATAPANLRMLAVNGAPGNKLENVGLRKIGARRRPGAPDVWDIFVAVHNYGTQVRSVGLELQFAKSPAGSTRMTLKPGAEEEAAFAYKSKVAGYLEARLDTRDAFPQDDRAIIELPSQTALRVAVYSNEPQLLRPLIEANPAVEAAFEPTANYDPAVKADVVVLDRFAPPLPPRVHAIWIQPPSVGSPVGVKSTQNGVKLDRWRAESPLGEGLHTQDVTLESGEFFSPAANDQVVAEGAGGALVVARSGASSGTTKLAVIGFHPGRAPMKYELATPLLFANILRWMTPGTFRRLELQAGTVGTVSVPVEADTKAADVQVLDEKQRPLPFTIAEGTLRFFAGAPGAVRVEMGDRELVYSLTLPDVAEAVWQPPAGVRRGIPRAAAATAAATDIWPWLAVLGGLGLLADWLLFGRSRAFRLRASKMTTPLRAVWRKAS